MSDPVIPEELKLKDALATAFKAGESKSNYVADIAGDLGIMATAPSITNVPNTLTISAHGSPFGGFSPDKSATNELSTVIKKRLDSGKELTVEDIADAMGSATNNVKRVIISACYAAGYNYDHLKTLFPNLEQIVAPSTDKTTSAMYNRNLTRPVPNPATHSLAYISPFFSVTKGSTNVVTSAKDWLPKEEQKLAEIPLSEGEVEMDKSLGRFYEQHPDQKIAWSPTNYDSTLHLPDSTFHAIREKKLAEIKNWYKEAYKKAKTDKEIKAVSEESQRRIDEVFK